MADDEFCDESTTKKEFQQSINLIQFSYNNEVPISVGFYKSQLGTLLSDSNTTKYCFNKFVISNIYMMLSVYKIPRLTEDLVKIKSNLGIRLIQFENARIELKSFILLNEHGNINFLLKMIKEHYR